MICTVEWLVLLHGLYYCTICTAARFVLLRDLYCCAICTAAWFVLLRVLFCCEICTASWFVLLRDLYCCAICSAAQFVLLRDLYCCARVTISGMKSAELSARMEWGGGLTVLGGQPSERWLPRRPRNIWWMILNLSFRLGWKGVNWIHLAVGCCEYGDEQLVFIKRRKFIG